MRVVGMLAALTAAVWLVQLALAGFARAEPAGVVIETIPSAVEFPSVGERVRALVLLRNPTTATLRDVTLTCFTNAPVKVFDEAGDELSSRGLSLDLLGPGAEHAWTLWLKQTSDSPLADSLHLRVDYTLQPEGQAQGARHLAFGSLDLKARPVEAAEQVAAVDVKTTLVSLSEQRPGIVYLLVTNTSPRPIAVEKIAPKGPSFITFEPGSQGTAPAAAPKGQTVIAFDEGGSGGGLRLEPRESRALDVVVKAPGVVRPGKHLLLFEVTLGWMKDDRPQRGTLVASREVDVGVLGESELLTALAVPSFLFLPGFLMVVAVQMLSALGKTSAGSERLSQRLKPLTPEFLVAAITLSIVAALVYPEATRLLVGARRSYLEGYALVDVVGVWAGSLLVAVVGYAVAATARRGIRRGRRWLEQWRVRRALPQPGEEPVKALRKVQRWREQVGLRRVRLEGELNYAFELEEATDDQEWRTVGPLIRLEWLRNDATLKAEVGKRLRTRAALGELIELLEEGQTGAAPALELSWIGWKHRAWREGPRRVQRAEVAERLDEGVIVSDVAEEEP